MKFALAVLLLALTASAQDFFKIQEQPKPSHQWAYSAAFLASAEVADAMSSRGLYELNPILGNGQFGARQASIKGIVSGGLILSEWLILRHHPQYRKTFERVNWIGGSVTYGVAARNLATH